MIITRNRYKDDWSLYFGKLFMYKILKTSDIFPKKCYTSINLDGSTTVICGPTLSFVGHVVHWCAGDFV